MDGRTDQLRLIPTQPSLAGVGAGAELGKNRGVIDWFTSLGNKHRLNFIVFDIESFYPSITPELLKRALRWARNYVTVTQQQEKTIHQASQSFLYNEGVPWVKKWGVNFDIGMGAYHGERERERERDSYQPPGC